MSPTMSTDWTDSQGEQDLAEQRGSAPPELFNRRKVVARVRKRARRGRANEVAKRGMHQRRNKRTAW
jgi:hypothetical protein